MKLIFIAVLLLSGCSVTGPSIKDANDQLKAHQIAHTKMLQEAREAEMARTAKRQALIKEGKITGGSNEMPDYWLLFR